MYVEGGGPGRDVHDIRLHCVLKVEGLAVAYTSGDQKTSSQPVSVILFDLSKTSSEPHDSYTLTRYVLIVRPCNLRKILVDQIETSCYRFMLP